MDDVCLLLDLQRKLVGKCLDELTAILATKNEDDNNADDKHKDAAKKWKQKMVKKLDNFTKELSSDGSRFREFAKLVDRVSDNLYTELGNPDARMADKDRQLFLYQIMGLRNRSIAYLMGEKDPSSVWNRKYRFKFKLETFMESRKGRFGRVGLMLLDGFKAKEREDGDEKNAEGTP